MNWKLSTDQSQWLYCDAGGRVVARLWWDNPHLVYRDGEGRSLGRKFNAARKGIEDGLPPQEEQARLTW